MFYQNIIKSVELRLKKFISFRLTLKTKGKKSKLQLIYLRNSPLSDKSF